MHDCCPTTPSMAFPAKSFAEAEAQNMNLPGWTSDWCGDVWKTIVHLRSSRNDLAVAVLDCDLVEFKRSGVYSYILKGLVITVQ